MMKKVLITIVMFLPIVASAFSGEVDIDGVKYSISTKTQTASAIGLSNSDYTGALIIHGFVVYEDKTCNVSTVSGFAGSLGITSVTIEEGITTINREAFKDCARLEEINLAKSVIDIDRYAFDGTAWYNNQSDGVLYLNHVAYSYKGEMPQDAEINIQEGTTIVAKYCFYKADKLKYIHFPKTLKSIDEYAFQRCSSLLSVSLNNLNVHYGSFANCTSLKEVRLDNVNFIPHKNVDGSKVYDFFWGSNAIETVYYNCKVVETWLNKKSSITSLTFGDEVETIKPDAFAECTGIKSVILPNSLKHLSGFSSCTGLTSLAIPYSVKTIDTDAFLGCTGLTSLVIPSNVETIDRHAFSYCYGLTSVELSEGVRIIGDGAFESCTGLTVFTIPNSVDSIGGAFHGCSNLISITLPQRINAIGGGAFQYCNELLSLTLPNGLTTVEAALCYGCKKLSEVIIPNSVTTIYGDSFSECTDLENVYCYAAAVPTNAYINYGNIHMYEGSPFVKSDIQHATLHVPSQSIESYRAAKYWQDFGEIVAIPDYEAKKCATPKISYQNGKLEFTCDTEGAQFYSEITDSDIKNSTESIVNLTATYNIKVYATAPDHAQSETIYATLCWIDATPRTEGLSINITSIPSRAILIQSYDGQLTIEGVDEGTPISIYDTTGRMVGSVKASAVTTNVSTSLRNGEIGIMKIGDRTIKVLMK